jgi:multiple sugar transport system substrate-binding protein
MSTQHDDVSPLRLLVSDRTLSRRGFIASALAFGGALSLGSTEAVARVPATRPRNTVTITSFTFSGQRWGRVQQALVPGFEKENPGVLVRLSTYPISQGFGRMLEAVAIGSTEYDLIELDYNFLAQIAARLTPLDPFLKRDAAYAADYRASVPPNVRNLYVYHGTTYGIANDSNTQMGYYRTDVFEKAGIKSPPQTWDEVLRVAKELTVKSPSGMQYGFSSNGQRGVFSSTLFGQMLLSYGGEWLDSHNRPTLLTPEAHDALTMLQKLMKYADPSVVNAADNETINAMASGVAVYAPNAWGNNAFTNPKLNKYGHVIRSTVVPKGPGPHGRHMPLMGGFGLVIPAASLHKEEAWKFIQYLTAKRNMKTYVYASGQPARTDALRQYASVAQMFIGLADSLPLAHRQPQLKDQTAFYEALGTPVSLVMTGQLSVSAALKQAQAATTAVLTKSGDIKK